MKLSVVIPVYNEKGTIREIYDSVRAVEIDKEIILVDDGLPDRCGEMCDELPSTDERIRVIHKTNGGLCSARNAGLDRLAGEFVTFVDSDDWVHSEFIRALLDRLAQEGGDIAFCRAQRVHETEGEHRDAEARVPGQRAMEPKSVLRPVLHQDESCENAWAKLFRASLFGDVRFPEDGRPAEDLATNCRLLFGSRRGVLCDAPCYYYLLRNEGLDGAPVDDSRLNLIDVVDEMCTAVSAVYPELKSAATCRRLSACFSVLVQNAAWQVRPPSDEAVERRAESPSRGSVRWRRQAKVACGSCGLALWARVHHRRLWAIRLKSQVVMTYMVAVASNCALAWLAARAGSVEPSERGLTPHMSTVLLFLPRVGALRGVHDPASRRDGLSADLRIARCCTTASGVIAQ